MGFEHDPHNNKFDKTEGEKRMSVLLKASGYDGRARYNGKGSLSHIGYSELRHSVSCPM